MHLVVYCSVEEKNVKFSVRNNVYFPSEIQATCFELISVSVIRLLYEITVRIN